MIDNFSQQKFKLRCGERSFTIFEVIIAITIMATMIVEMVGFQGNVLSSSEYGINATRATWLAKRVMSQVEYLAQKRPWSELKHEPTSETPFEDEPEFSYKLTIKEWKLPLLEGFLNQEKGEEGGGNNALSEAGVPAGMVGDAIKQKVGDDLLKVAHVEVSWPEGARRSSVSLSLLLTNQKMVDEQLELLKNDYENLLKLERGGGRSGPAQPQQQPKPQSQTNPMLP